MKIQGRFFGPSANVRTLLSRPVPKRLVDTSVACRHIEHHRRMNTDACVVDRLPGRGKQFVAVLVVVSAHRLRRSCRLRTAASGAPSAIAFAPRLLRAMNDHPGGRRDRRPLGRCAKRSPRASSPKTASEPASSQTCQLSARQAPGRLDALPNPDGSRDGTRTRRRDRCSTLTPRRCSLRMPVRAVSGGNQQRAVRVRASTDSIS